MSVGHVARLFEEAGIATAILAVSAFRERLEAMRVPRLVTTPHPMGRPVGAPGDVPGQRESLLAALELLWKAERAGTVLELTGKYRPTDSSRVQTSPTSLI